MSDIEDDGFVTVHPIRPAATKPIAEPAPEVVAVRHGFDGYGWQYMDAGSGSDWLERAMKLDDAEPLYDRDEIASWKMAADEAEREVKVRRTEVDRLTEQRNSARQQRDGLAFTLIEVQKERIAAEAERDAALEGMERQAREHATLLRAVVELVDRDCEYHGAEIRIPVASHGDAIRLVAQLRAAANLTHPSEASADE
jgi:hypothetical protein